LTGKSFVFLMHVKFDGAEIELIDQGPIFNVATEDEDDGGDGGGDDSDDDAIVIIIVCGMTLLHVYCRWGKCA
jgi:hypothetical protein